MGQAFFELELPMNAGAVSKKVPLRLLGDVDTVDREITGRLYVEYEWTPRAAPKEECKATEHDEFTAVHGSLKFTLLSGEKLVNLDLATPHSASNPYCTVLCYPMGPEVI